MPNQRKDPKPPSTPGPRESADYPRLSLPITPTTPQAYYTPGAFGREKMASVSKKNAKEKVKKESKKARRSTLPMTQEGAEPQELNLEEYTFEVFENMVKESAEGTYNQIWVLLREGEKHMDEALSLRAKLLLAGKDLTKAQAEIEALSDAKEELEQQKLQAEHNILNLKEDLEDAQAANEHADITNEQVAAYEQKINSLQRALESNRKKLLINMRTSKNTTQDDDNSVASSVQEEHRERQQSATPSNEELAAQVKFLIDNQTKNKKGKEAHIQDPPRFSNSKNMDFENWQKQVQAVFSVKTRTLAEPKEKMAYLFSLLEGEAQARCAPRFMSNKFDEYQNEEEMLEDLTATFVDPNATITAREDYRKLKQGDQESFTLFEQRFYKLATKAEIGQSEWEEDLLRMCRFDLRKAVHTSRDLHKGYFALKAHLNMVDRRMRAVDTEQKASKTVAPAVPSKQYIPWVAGGKSSTYTPGSFGGKVSNNAPPVANSKTVQFATKTALDPTKFPKPAMKQITPALRSNTGCYNCHQEGHQIRECPQLRSTIAEMGFSAADLLDFLAEADKSTKGEYDEDSEDSDSDESQGNDHA